MAPTVVKALRDVGAADGDKVTLECSFSGVPEPQMSWYKGRRAVRPSRDVVMTTAGGTATLCLREAIPSDSATYKCTAQNDAGSVDTSCILTVKGQWNFTVK